MGRKLWKSKVDDENLIFLVQENDCLYNKSNKDYKNEPKKIEVWEEIGRKVGLSGEECSKKWSVLREKYCNEVRRMQRSSKNGERILRKWIHFKSMNFLREHMFAKNRVSSSRRSARTEELLVAMKSTDSPGSNYTLFIVTADIDYTGGRKKRQLRVNGSELRKMMRENC